MDHLERAARALQGILDARQPEDAWSVEVKQLDRDDAHRLSAAPTRQAGIGAEGDHSDAFLERNAGTASEGALDQDAGEQAG